MRKLVLLVLLALPLSAQLERTAVLKLPAMESVDVRTNIAYVNDANGELKLDLYRPRNASGALPLVIFLNGVGRPDLKEWGQYTSWPRLVAARGMAAITHQTNGTDLAPQADALLRYVREHAAELKIDPKRIALWACSANSRLGTALVANRTGFRAAVFYYGLMEAAPKNDVTPVLIARAGLDALPLNDSIDRWVAGAVALDAPVTLLTYPEGRHAFDVDQDTVESKRIIGQTLDFLHHHLTTEPTPRTEPMSMSQLQRLIRDEGHARAIAVLQQLRKTHPKAYVLEEQTLNGLGYASLQQTKTDAAVAFFELTTSLYPTSANAHDSLGDAYEAAGRKADAIAAAERALQLLDQAPPPRRDGIRQSAEAKLQRLKS